jgi:hypothetical protein
MFMRAAARHIESRRVCMSAFSSGSGVLESLMDFCNEEDSPDAVLREFLVRLKL